MKNNCQFCPAASASFRTQIILETPYAIAIHPRRPLSPGHTIVFPKVHRRSVLEMTDSDLVGLFKLMKKIEKSLTKVYKTDSFNLFTNIGKEAGQSIPHVHFHIVPRSANEQTNPFKILNNRKLYKALMTVTPRQMDLNIKKIRKGLK
ncbi:MAG: HIT domain-containing protein [Candidatus Komeilibacteria bacterium]